MHVHATIPKGIRFVGQTAEVEIAELETSTSTSVWFGLSWFGKVAELGLA